MPTFFYIYKMGGRGRLWPIQTAKQRGPDRVNKGMSLRNDYENPVWTAAVAGSLATGEPLHSRTRVSELKSLV